MRSGEQIANFSNQVDAALDDVEKTLPEDLIIVRTSDQPRQVDGTRQGQAMGALSALNSLAAVIAPLFASMLLATVSHFPSHDWRVGAPMYFGAILQTLSLFFAVTHFRRHPIARPLAQPT